MCFTTHSSLILKLKFFRLFYGCQCLTLLVLTGTVDPTNDYLTLLRIRNKKSNQKPTWLIKILYASNVIFVLASTFCYLAIIHN